jgi:type I restriction-modification system DNA methylase subunit
MSEQVYVLLEAETSGELEIAVNEYLRADFVLAGGVSVSLGNYADRDGDLHTYRNYAQALIGDPENLDE